MKKMKKLIDVENPEWTEGDFKNARPALEVLPQILGEVEKKKESVSLRLSPEVLAYFRAYGNEWQNKLNEVLQEYIAVRQN